MRSLKLVMVVLVTVWLQVQFLGAIRPLSVLPNILIIVVIYAGLTATATETVGIAVGGGLLIDMYSGVDFGLRMAFYSALALGVIVLRRAGADFENISLVLVATAVGSLGYNLVVLAGLAGAANTFAWVYPVGRIGAETSINLILAVVLGPIIVRVVRTPVSQSVSMGHLR